jgi:uncharacterized membrane protein
MSTVAWVCVGVLGLIVYLAIVGIVHGSQDPTRYRNQETRLYNAIFWPFLPVFWLLCIPAWVSPRVRAYRKRAADRRVAREAEKIL